MTKKRKICLLVGVLLVIAGLGLFGFTVVQGATGFHSKYISIGMDEDGELGLLNIHDSVKYSVSPVTEVSQVEEVQIESSSASENGTASIENSADVPSADGSGKIENSAAVIPDNGDIRELNLAVEYAEVKIRPGKAFGVTTRGIGADQITVTNDNGAVTVSGGQEEWMYHDDYEVIITVPSDVKLESVQGTMSVGDVEIERLNTALIDLKVETGNVSIEETSADYAVVNCTTGEADFSGNFGTAEAEVKTGQIDFEGTAGTLNLKGTTGEIDVELRSSDYWVEVTCENGVIEMNDREFFDGYASFGDQSAANKANISLTTGEVSVEFGR